jgi:hypothetical protein
MPVRDLIRQTLDNSDQIVNAYIGDLSDADLMVRPAAGMNHIAWQLGHLISAERMFAEMVKPGVAPPLPAGFDEAHNKEATTSDDTKKFRTKAEYIDIWKAQRAATKSILDGMSDAELDAPSTNRFQGMAPTQGSVLLFNATHVLMHVGQWVGVRRQLGKPIVI